MSEPGTNESLGHWQRALASEFVLEREIERRGARVAFAARSLHDARPLVVNAIDASALDEHELAGLRAGLARAASLRHERILPIETIGEHDGSPWFTTPFVDGVTLATWLEREKQLPFLESARVLSELAQALAHAHAAGATHGDLTTHDVLWSETHAKLCHLGAAPCSTDATSADIRAFGAIAYEVLAGEKPNVSDGACITPVNALRHHIPPGLAYVVMRCLTNDRSRAWRSMDDLVPLVANLVTPPRGYEAPHLVNQGCYLLRQSGSFVREALERFEAAAAIDPCSVRAELGIAVATCLLALHGDERTDGAEERARRAAVRALTIDSKLLEVRLATRMVDAVFARDFDAARARASIEELRRELDDRP